MKKFEYTVIAFCSLGVIMTLLDLPISKHLTIISFLILIAFYMLFGFAHFNQLRFNRIFKKSEYKGISWKRMVGSVIYGITLGGGIIIAILYQIFNWPNANYLTNNNLKLFAVVLLVSLIFYVRKKDSFHRRLLIRGAIAFILCLLTLLI